jgi:hypothetical protein
MDDSSKRSIRVELASRDAFWRNAVLVEWEHQFPGRAIRAEGGNVYVIEEDWFDDFERVATKCFSQVVYAPADPSRRQLFRRLFALDARR